VLPVKLDEPRRQLLQSAGGRQGAVDERTTAPLRGDLAADQELFAIGFEDRLD